MADINKPELIALLSEKHPNIPQWEIKHFLELFSQEVGKQLADGNKIELRGFGVFKLRKSRAGTRRNPKTGETFQLKDPIANPMFTPSKSTIEIIE